MNTTSNHPQQPVTPNPNEDQNLQPNTPDTEINPGSTGNNTEVDLDKTKIDTYPKTHPPERH